LTQTLLIFDSEGFVLGSSKITFIFGGNTDEVSEAQATVTEMAENSSVPTEPVSTAATTGNPNSPTLSKAGSFNGLTIDVSKLTSDFIELGTASDLDGDLVSVDWEISPSTNLVTFDASSNVLDLSLEKLFALAQSSGPKLFEIKVWASDSNLERRKTTYTFKLKVPTLSNSDVRAFFAQLTNERLSALANIKLEEGIPFISSIQVSRTGEVFVKFSDELETFSSANVTEDDLKVKLIPPKLSSRGLFARTVEDKTFDWKATKFTSRQLTLQLSFSSPHLISSEGSSFRDILEVRVQNPFLFKSKASQEVIPHGDSAHAYIPQQTSNDEAETIDFIIMASQVGFFATMAPTAWTYSVTGGASVLWSMINVVQFLALIGDMNLFIPANAEAYFAFMSSVADFEILNTDDWLYTPMYDFLTWIDSGNWMFESNGKESLRRTQKKKPRGGLEIEGQQEK
jgi:hypothetical protein